MYMMMVELLFGAFQMKYVFKNDCLKKTSKFPMSLIIWDCMSFKGPRKIIIISSMCTLKSRIIFSFY